MRLSNKSTFSLICLVLLLAFVAIPVMAHVLPDPADPDNNLSGHDTTDAAHAVVKSVALKGDAADGYVDGDSFLVEVAFEAANATNKIIVPASALTTGDISATGFNVLEVLKKSNTLYEARLRRNNAGDGTAVTITTGVGYTQPNADGPDTGTDPDTGPDADRANPDKAVVIYDATPPDIHDGKNNNDPNSPATDETPPAAQPVGGNLAPLPGNGWSDPFRLVFTITSDASNDLSTLDFTADPAHLMFGSPGGTGVADQYAVDVTYKDVNVAANTDVIITIEVSDKADNKGSTTFTVTLAARTPAPAKIPTLALGNTTPGGSLTVTFDKDPGTVTATGYTVTGSGKTHTIAVPADKASGSHSISLKWTGPPAGTGTVTYTIPEAEANTSPDITIPAGEFVVVVVDKTGTMGSLLTNYDPDITLEAWSAMPDLYNIFDTKAIHGGGALILREAGASPTLNPGTVGISEIMWAIDESKLGNATTRKAEQWIELHNLNTTAATVKLSWKTGAKAIAENDSINGNLDRPYLDVVTNVFHERPGDRRGSWVLPGQNGNPRAGTNFVSAARIGVGDDKTFDLTSKHDGKFNKRYTKSDKRENASNSPDGRNPGQWAASTVPYARRTHFQGTGLGNIVYEDHGTPGRVNKFKPEEAIVRDATQNVPASPIIINEVANRDDANNKYEWIELRNVSNGNINLKHYRISILTAVDKDEAFINLPNQDINVPAGGVLLLVDSDPYGDADHPLAVGWNVDKNAEDQIPGLKALGINASSLHGRYKVIQFGGHGGKFTSGLPNDGDFILVVRESHKKEGKALANLGTGDIDRINDIAGYDGDLKARQNNPLTKTSLWPLKAQSAPDSDKNKLVAGIVHHRQYLVANGRAGAGTSHGDKKEGQVAFGHAVYTGIGYKRQATNSSMHGGTPGYDNGAQKGKVTDLAAPKDLAMAKLRISEMMLSQGPEDARTALPQWIEIYNPSPHPVNLAGWKLIIENPRDPIRTINLGGGSVKSILSKQTILVISGSARDIGSDTLPASTTFPTTRVYNVYKHQKDEFNMTDRFDPILNTEAFNITLIDGTALDTSKADQQPEEGKHLRHSGKYYTISDVVGNLDGNPRTNDTPEDNDKMKFTMGMTEDGDRTSLIRIFDEGVARDGTLLVKPLGGTGGVGVARMKGVDSKYGWVHAADTKNRFVRHTWYGDESDWGTPLDRGGQILPVELSHFRPTLENGQVVIRWTTESELDNAGFNILRSDTRKGEYKQVNAQLIQGHGTTGERHTYKWVDASAKPGVVYYYQIEDVSFAGERQTLQTTKLKGYISAVGKATTTWGDIKEVQ